MISAGYMVRATYLAVTRALQQRLKVYKLTSPQWFFNVLATKQDR